MEILCFYAGIAFVYTKSIYSLLLIAISLFFKPYWPLVIWFLAALCWGFSHQFWVKDVGMPDVRVLSKARVEGAIVSIPNSSTAKTQFQFHAIRLNEKSVDATILLSCYQNCPLFKVGEKWLLDLKLKKPENLGNPGRFDFVNSLKARHINWTGYIRRGAIKLSERSEKQDILSVREKLAETMEKSLLNSPTLGVMQALTLNVTTHIDKSQWELFRRTGTTHLMVISGSHIGLIAGLCFWIVKWLWSRFGRLTLYCPAVKIASILGFLSAFIYALLAGFEPPSQRSLIACFFLFLRNFISQRFTVWQAWRYGLFLVLIYEPHAVLLPGFYLSFIAVAVLIMINRRIVGGTIKKTIYIQLACLFGLMPLSLYWFSYGAVNGLFANLLAIPLVGFVIVPFALINLVLLQVFKIDFLVAPVKFSIAALFYYLQWIDSFAFMNFNFSYNDLLAPLALMLAMFLLIFMRIKAVFPAVFILILSGLFPAYKRVATGDVRVDILDVGQGLAVVVQTAKHLLIYDTGMKFYQGGDMGKLAIIPYLNQLGITNIDKIVISHPDLDHRGGLSSLEEKYAIGELLVDKVSFYRRGKSCHQYPDWDWDGVSFRFLSISKKFHDKNNSSCVLMIENKAGRVLLTGDIEKRAEDYLIKTYGKQLKADVLLIPHHGSKTSSSPEFIKEISPKYAVISLGFDNRYHFPHEKTLATMASQNIPIYYTSDCGMVTLDLKKPFFKPSCYKKH